MRPKWYEWIPFYGAWKYFNRYFDAEQRTDPKEVQIATLMNAYHLIVAAFSVLLIAKLFV